MRLDTLFSTFDAAATRRRSGASAVAHLSGGLDSRCAIAALRRHGAAVHALNYAPDGSADHVLGRLAAEKRGAIYFERHHGEPDFRQRMVAIHDVWQAQAPMQPRWPRQAWARFGGELVLAPVNITESIAAQMRAGDTDGAIAQFLAREGAALPGRLIVDECRAELLSANADAVRGDVRQFGCADPARRLHLYALLDETRGQLAQHDEDIDLCRLEFRMRFCDSAFLSFVLSQPLDAFAGHRLYHQWLSRFPAEVAHVPWQTYSGHDACPLPIPQTLRLQRDAWHTRNEPRRAGQLALAQLARDLNQPHFPRHVLRRPVLQVARWLAQLGLERYEYLFPIAHTFVRFAGGSGRSAEPPAAMMHSAQRLVG